MEVKNSLTSILPTVHTYVVICFSVGILEVLLRLTDGRKQFCLLPLVQSKVINSFTLGYYE